MRHKIANFTLVAAQPPDEIRAVVAEGGLGEGDFLEVVPRRSGACCRLPQCLVLAARGRGALLVLLGGRPALATPELGAGRRAAAVASSSASVAQIPKPGSRSVRCHLSLSQAGEEGPRRARQTRKRARRKGGDLGTGSGRLRAGN